MFRIILIILGIMGVIGAMILIGYIICFFIGEELKILDRIFDKWRK